VNLPLYYIPEEEDKMPELTLEGDCKSSTTTLVVAIDDDTQQYFWSSSRGQEMVTAQTNATQKAWGKFWSKVAFPACIAPCKPFALLKNVDVSAAVADGSVWYKAWLWYYVKVTVTIKADVVVGCSQ
jgi:hypothetical protein